MKNFFTSMFGALTALVLFCLGGAVLFVVVLLAMAAAGREKPVAFEKGSYLVFNLSVNISDSPPPFDRAALVKMFNGDNETHALQLRQITRSLKAAAKDDRIAGIYLTGNVSSSAYGSGFAALKEVRDALVLVKAAGKPIIAFIGEATTRDMYLASVANEIVLDPFGMIVMPGLASEPMFFTGAFEKYGIGVQVTRVGKYKSFVEPFVRKDMSPESREQTQKLLDDIWGNLVAEVSASRGITAQQLQAVVDSEGVIRPAEALKQKLVTRVDYRDSVLDELKDRTGRKNSKEPFKQVSLVQYSTVVHDEAKSAKNDTIAVVYAEGAIVDGKGEMDEVGGERFSREIRRLREDGEVKAIVLRVNSPGGSVSGSEEILREVRLAQKAKPVIVSMGSYAASGGYWISAYGDRIFAEPTTITGSIGVFGILFNVQKLASDVGLSFDRVKTGKFADLISVTRPKTDEELALFQHLVDWIYGEFVGKVAEARKLDRAKVQDMAQGRVWSGTEAVTLGLVDELGGLDTAIRFAAERAGLGEHYRLSEYPGKKDFKQLIAEAMNNARPTTSRSSGVVSQLLERFRGEAKTLEQFNAVDGLYARLPIELQIN